MIPDAIVIFSGGVVMDEKGGQGCWCSTTYNDNDAFGVIGGRDRIEAASLLAKKYHRAYLVTTSRRMTNKSPTLAEVYGNELQHLGVSAERIIKEEISINTKTAIEQTVSLAKSKGWKNLLFVSSEYHLPRILAFCEKLNNNIAISTISSETVLIENDVAFAEIFEKIKKTPAYKTRLTAEARGITAIKKGIYRFAQVEDKKERTIDIEYF